MGVAMERVEDQAGGPSGEIGAAEAAVWADWRRLARAYSVWRAPLDIARTRSSGAVFAGDHVSDLRRAPGLKSVFAVLDARPEHFERLTVLAQLNLERSRGLLRMTALVYLSVPTSVVLALVQLAPEWLLGVYQEWRATLTWPAVALALSLIYYGLGALRAQALAQALTLWRVANPETISRSEAAPPSARNRSASPRSRRA